MVSGRAATGKWIIMPRTSKVACIDIQGNQSVQTGALSEFDADSTGTKRKLRRHLMVAQNKMSILMENSKIGSSALSLSNPKLPSSLSQVLHGLWRLGERERAEPSTVNRATCDSSKIEGKRPQVRLIILLHFLRSSSSFPRVFECFERSRRFFLVTR
ncbi:Hypothetical predicted protein [Prunus dulcis]|uniref:Uncharacterized protein n=1 Tax=Prunus dulcis TaxID=3755 RepID=A0A5E4E6U4_PRUDU|nr:Hypothetical predicted protein [Prunus dulcis]